MLSMWTCQNISHMQVYLLFCNPAHWTETRTANRWELLIAESHVDESLWLANQKQGAAVRSYLLHSSLAGAQLCCGFYQPQRSEQNMQEKNHFPETYVGFSSSNFTYWTPVGMLLVTRNLSVLNIQNKSDAFKNQNTQYSDTNSRRRRDNSGVRESPESNNPW